MLIVLDTNIIVSAMLSPNGSAFCFLSDVLDGKHQVLVSEEIYQEYDEVLHRKKFGFDEDIVSFILNWFIKNAIWIEPKQSIEPVPDEKDRIFFDLAVVCKAKLVTGNIKHYPVHELVTSLAEVLY